MERHIPNAELVCLASTALAARTVANNTEVCGDAAVCSKICVSIYSGLEVLVEGIQDKDTNKTRFMVLSSDIDANIPAAKGEGCRRGLIRVGIRDRNGVDFLIKAPKLKVTRIDRRPSLTLSGSDYFLEVEAEREYEEREWREKVEETCSLVEGILVGIWI